MKRVISFGLFLIFAGLVILRQEDLITIVNTYILPNKSFVTIEVKNNKIVQARAKFNEEPQDEIMKILRKWETTLLSVENEEIIDDIVE